MRTKLYGVAGLLILVLSLGLAACGDVVTPTPAAVQGATATVAAATTAAVVPTNTALPVLPTSTPLAPKTTVAAATAAPAATTAITTAASVATTAATSVAPAATVVSVGTNAVAATIPTTANAARLAYVDGYALVVIDIATKTSKKLSEGGEQGILGNPTWSPDNKFLAFATQGNVKVASSRAVLYTYNFERPNGFRRLVNDQPENASDIDPVWSPDGTTIAFTRRIAAPGTASFDQFKSKNEVWLVDADAQNPRKLADGQQPAWSPDSRRLAFVTDGAVKPGLTLPQGNALHLINAKGQNEWEPINTAKIPSDLTKFNYPFSGEAYRIQSPTFLEGGKSLGFATVGATGLVLSIDSTTGGNLKMWSGQPEGGYGRTWASPKTGSLLLYEGYPPSGVRSFSIVDVTKAPAPDKPVLQTFGGPTKGEALLPTWSPDGSQIAYVLLPKSTGGGDLATPVSGTLVLGKVGSTEVVELTKGTISGLAWSR